ncbi:helix-turn-helix domain-containing protein [Streptomyces physcomitrii]|uniref:Helix-turn-helix domain-containing protein n=1 Tax=Streptomyces physcomitrii TaxID=2724184 RepID=A0ABX1H8Z5_9ACTN|nr:helix-turn-helix domain-containing protein [Streptomyces physcomitrii]NKI44527.1 helix-turn-helix domain-containing protein [Streptomyces physcomitrii]
MYRERPARLDGAQVWSRTPGPGPLSAVLPDGCMDLLWVRGHLYVAGPDTRAFRPGAAEGPLGQDVAMAGVRFPPGRAPAVLGVPAHALLDQRVPLAELWPAAEVREFTARVDAARDPGAALEALALRQAARGKPADPLLTRLVAALDAGGSVAATAEAAGLGTRQLHRLSLTAFGYGPKTLARILRLQRALALARAGTAFATTAALSGYADQAHLAREVRELTGMPLGELLGREG